MATRHRHNVLPKVLRNDVEIPVEPTASLKMVTKTVTMTAQAGTKERRDF
jgi:hypothetical protein